MTADNHPFPSPWELRPLDLFLCADPALLGERLRARPAAIALSCGVAIVFGAGLYGAAMGWWRDPLQALYTGLKLPLVILLTTLGNGLLNGMLAPLLGLNLSFRQSLMVVLMSFAIASVILGALSPVALFIVWNTPPLTAMTRLTSPEYGFLQLSLVTFIAFAGMTGNRCLVPLLREWSGSVATARRVLLVWLAVNLLLGSQICWVLRPFLWDPSRPVEFLGPEYLRGSFYETVFHALCQLLLP
ncbi:MAG: hypothetical protein HZA90_28735 [Verrucomicrobia bacterium]|nr:hypothetical protein [Verrucomicrobiota bacterium]